MLHQPLSNLYGATYVCDTWYKGTIAILILEGEGGGGTVENIEHFCAISKNYHILKFLAISISFYFFEYLYLLAVLINIQNWIFNDILK